MSKGILSSSIAKKFWMGLTGLFLITFLIVHCAVNAMIFFNDGGLMFNKAAHFMGTNILIRSAEIVLFAGLILHIVDGLMPERNRVPVVSGILDLWLFWGH
jgi:succinate dehydrogenase / fumarate reductase cytochrome b subunit